MIGSHVGLLATEMVAQPANNLPDPQDLRGCFVQVFSGGRDTFARCVLKPQSGCRDEEAGSRQMLIKLMHQSSNQLLYRSSRPFTKIFTRRTLQAGIPALQRGDLVPQSARRLVERRGLNGNLLHESLIAPHQRSL